MNQKNLFNNSYATDKVGHHQIKCPYCRTIKNYILPQTIDIENVTNKRFVNVPKSKTMTIKCEFDNLCERFSYVTPIGHFCKLHHKKTKTINDSSIKSLKIKTIKPKNIKPKTNDVNSDPHNQTIEQQMDTFGKMHTINELKAILKLNNLKVSGVKSDLINRIFKFEINKL